MSVMVGRWYRDYTGNGLGLPRKWTDNGPIRDRRRMASDLMKEEFEWQSGKVDKVTVNKHISIV